MKRELSRRSGGAVAIPVGMVCFVVVSCGGARPEANIDTETAIGTPARVEQSTTIASNEAIATDEARPAVGGARPPVVPIVATVHAMSQCPYAAKSLATLIPIVRQLGPAIEFDLEYVGRFDGPSDPTSMHGPSEVAGDVLQLCAHAYGTTEQWLDFVACQTADADSIPDGWQTCANNAGLDIDTLRRCAVSDEGLELLRRSFAASEQAGAKGSPTFFIGDARYSGSRTSEGFGRALCARYERARPTYCQQLPPQPHVKVHILFDGRCPPSLCDVAAAERDVLTRVGSAESAIYDYRSQKGRAMFHGLGLRFLPAVVVEGPVEEEVRSELREYELVQDDYVKTFGRFDPLAGAVRPVTPVRVTFLVDGRCSTRECTSMDRFEAFLEREAPSVEVTRLDVLSPEGKALWQRSRTALQSDGRRVPALPLVLFPQELHEEPTLLHRLERRFVPSIDGFLFQLGTWDPDGEICDNSVDDDGDRAIDCRDPDCAQTLACRPEKARRLELFMMSQCPFAANVVEATIPVLDHFKRQRSKIDLRVNWVGSVGDDGTLSSMHGESELEEDLRQVCAQRHYAKGYRFMDYIACRVADSRNPDWAQCIREPMKASVIETCAEGEEGRTLLRASFELTDDLGIRGSPSWLLNGRHDMSNARKTVEVFEEFCSLNKIAECRRPISDVPPAAALATAAAPGKAPTYIDLIVTAQP